MKPIWIVDDDQSIRFVLEKALAREQFPVRSFSNPRDVLAALDDDEAPQVLVSDIRMPGGSGIDLLGKRLDMTEGLIELQGSMIPVLRLVAQTVQDSITTRIIVDGDIRDPDITFESDPELPQEEVLSHLLFGRGLDSISALQAAQLANAVAVLAGRGSEGIVSSLRNSVGLDDLDLATDDQGNVSVRAGKYIARNVYTDVSVDADGKSRINLNLDVNDKVTARGSMASDGESTLGLFYERDY